MNAILDRLPCQQRRYISAAAGAAVVIFGKETMFPQFSPNIHFAIAGVAGEMAASAQNSLTMPGMYDAACSAMYGVAGGMVMKYASKVL